MSLLGIDVGTTGCKAIIFSEQAEIIAMSYTEFEIQSQEPGYAQLDSPMVWEQIKTCIKEVAFKAKKDPVKAISVSSLAEAVVPVTMNREILGPSILNFDVRGEDFLDEVHDKISNEELYQINGNTIGNNYSLTKLLWIKKYQPELYERADKLLLWGSFVNFMLGAEAAVDCSLANRTLLLDINAEDWSDYLLDLFGLDREKLPVIRPSSHQVGTIDARLAGELGLPSGVKLVTGAHDQCANALGCGVIKEGNAMYGMGTFICIVPVFGERKPAGAMLSNGLCTEHHSIGNTFISLIYNQGGILFKWFRDTFAGNEKEDDEQKGIDTYTRLISEMPRHPGNVYVLPHFMITGPPGFIPDSSGLITGLTLETTRGEILKGILEGATFYLKECVDSLPSAGIAIDSFIATGGGSKSDEWLQLSADIINRPFYRPVITEAGALGVAILAGKGSGIFSTFEEGVNAMIRIDREYTPDNETSAVYREKFSRYKELWPAVGNYLRGLNQ